MNRRADITLPAISKRAETQHEQLIIADLHSDTLLWDRNLLNRAGHGHMDLPRLEEGNVALQILSSVTKTPGGQNYDSNPSNTDNILWFVIGQLQPFRTWTSLLERSLYHAAKLAEAEVDSEGALRIVRTHADIDSLLADRNLGEPVPGRCSRSRECTVWRARRPISTGCSTPDSAWSASPISSTMNWVDQCTARKRAG